MAFNQKQAGAICRGVRLAERYRKENRSDIIDQFRSGSSLIEIAKQERVSNGEGILSENIVSHGVMFFLRGYDGRLKGTHSFEGAMDFLEYREISEEHKKCSGRERARLNLLESSGFYGLTEKQKQNGLRKSIIARGQIPWSDAEIQDCVSMINSQDFSYPTESRWAGEINRKHIAEAINDKYHDGRSVRNKGSISYIKRRNDN